MLPNDDKTICSMARPSDGTVLSRGFAGRRAGRHTGGFTLAELLVAILVIGVLISLIIVAVNAATGGTRRQAQQQTVTGMAQAVMQFEQTFGFPPPLVQDGIVGTAGAMDVVPATIDRSGAVADGTPVQVVPSNTSLRVAVTYNPAFAPNRRFLEGLDPETSGAPDFADLSERYSPDADEVAWRRANQRYSKYSLGYYLAGALPASVDGVEGPGMVRPLQDGTFEGVEAASADEFETGGSTRARDRYEPFFDADSRSAQIRREYFDINEYRENTGDLDYEVGVPADETDWRHVAITDSNGIAYRYYRWQPLSTAYGIDVTATYQLNIPWILLDDAALNRLADAGSESEAAAIDLTAGNAELRGARWAIVGAGQDGLFGTEPIERLRGEQGLPAGGLADWEVRALAKEDNIVEVGR